MSLPTLSGGKGNLHSWMLRTLMAIFYNRRLTMGNPTVNIYMLTVATTIVRSVQVAEGEVIRIVLKAPKPNFTI